MDLFKKEDFDLFKNFGGKSQQEAPQAQQPLREVYDKLGKVADLLLNTGKYHVDIRRNPLNLGQKYEVYHWARVYPIDLYEDCCDRVFFVIGTNSEGFNIHIDSYISKGNIQNERAENIKNKTREQIDIDTVCSLSFKEISQRIDNYCQTHEDDFLHFAKEFNIQKCIELLKSKIMNEYIELLENNHNLILTGAPGTGKTYLARQIAAKMILGKPYSDEISVEEKETFDEHCKFVQFHPSYDYTDFVEGLRPKGENGNIGFERKDGVFKEFCRRTLTNEMLLENKNVFDTIYQSIYNDIDKGKIKQLKNPQYGKFDVAIENDKIVFGGDKRTESKENLKLLFDYYVLNNIFNLSDFSKEDYWALITKLTNGITKTIDYTYYYGLLQKMLDRANKKYPEDKAPFIFLIDEINRGEISKIFGELFFSIDPGYRGERGLVQTQYQNLITNKEDVFYKGFYIPENVFIIGTMNDIDRSVESMDFAMRRRFAWLEVKAEENTGMLDELGELKDEVVAKMKNLNTAIERIEELNSSYHIGGAYFAKLALYLNENKSNKDEANAKLWSNHLRGLLFEYLRGIPNADEELNNLKKAYDGITQIQG
jgi:GTPase subunit of restriction endonuclease